MATTINIRTLLEAGCHFGHQTRRWNPKMKEYIFGERNGIYILDLKQTIINADQAYSFLKTVSRGGQVLFVGTKKQARRPSSPLRARRHALHQPALARRYADQLRHHSLRINRMWRSSRLWSRTAAWLFCPEGAGCSG